MRRQLVEEGIIRDYGSVNWTVQLLSVNDFGRLMAVDPVTDRNQLTGRNHVALEVSALLPTPTRNVLVLTNDGDTNHGTSVWVNNAVGSISDIKEFVRIISSDLR
jgi:hypothetical protein